MRKLGFTTRSVIITTVMMLVINVALGAFLISRSRESIRKLIDERMLGVSRTAASMLDGDLLDSLTMDDEGGERQQQVLSTLDYFFENMDILYIYAVRPYEDHFIFIADTDPVAPAAFGERVTNSEALESAGRGEAAVDKVMINDKWGKYYSAYTPVMTSDGRVGGIVGVDFDATMFEKQISDNTLYLLILAAFSLLIGGGIVMVITHRLRRRFRQLNEEMTSLAGDLGTLMDEISSEAGYADIAPEASLLSGFETVTAENSGMGGSIEKLSEEVRIIKLNLKKYITFVHDKAYIDGMTGVCSKTAYIELVHDLDQRIADGEAEFSIAVFDVNGLKMINDDYGHETGDEILIASASCIRKVFETRRTFRIGGDEFIAVLPVMSDEDIYSAFAKIDTEVELANRNLTGAKVSLSKGYATFRPGEDKEYRAVFKRADQSMYRDKEAFYRTYGSRHQYYGAIMSQ